jgi:hypothetical protein
MKLLYIFRMCLDGERINIKIALLFGLVVENNVRLMIFSEM